MWFINRRLVVCNEIFRNRHLISLICMGVNYFVKKLNRSQIISFGHIVKS